MGFWIMHRHGRWILFGGFIELLSVYAESRGEAKVLMLASLEQMAREFPERAEVCKNAIAALWAE